MSFVSYNGLELELLRTEKYEKIPEFDSQRNYLYTTHRIHVHTVYNPQGTSYRRAAATVVSSVQAPAVTEAAIRHKLLQPRGRLICKVGTDTILDVPNTHVQVDSANGPYCESCNIVEVHGEKSFMVEAIFVAHVNECEVWGDVDNQAFLLSHTVSMSETIDELNRSVRVIRGRCEFDAERMQTEGIEPDHLRSKLIPFPLPRHKRISLEIEAEESGRVLNYTDVTKIERLSLLNGKIPKVEVKHAGGFARPGYADTGLNLAGTAVRWALDFVGIEGDDTNAQMISNLQLHSSLLGGIAANIPTRLQEIEVKVYGNVDTEMRELSRVAWNIVQFRLGALGAGDLNTLFRLNLSAREVHDPVEGTVTVSVVLTSGVSDLVMNLGESVASNGAAGALAVTPIAANINLSPNDDIDPGVAIWGSRNGVFGASMPPNHKGTRGYSLALVLANALTGDCQKPFDPQTRIRNATATTLEPHRPA